MCRHRDRERILVTLVLLAVGTSLFGAERERDGTGFDPLIQPRAGAVIGIKPSAIASLPAGDPLRQEWEQVDLGGARRVWLDARSGLPALVTLQGVAWPGQPSVDALAQRARDLLEQESKLLGNWGDQLVLDSEGSGPRGADVWQVRFAQVVDGVPVEGARYDFQVAHGNLVAFGATRWAPVRISAVPSLTAAEARLDLDRYVRPSEYDGITDLDPAELLLLPFDANTDQTTVWAGTRGEGYAHRLIWRFRFTDVSGIAIWTGEVDAHTGEIVAFYDDARYDGIKGSVNPISDDGVCVDDGCPVPDYPLPFADYTENGGAVQYAGQHGLYTCGSPGSTIETTLDGQYFRIVDVCGPISATTPCDDDLDLGVADDINCGVAAGAAAGNTDAARSAYYSLNLVNRKARFWISGNAWLDSSVVQTNTNVNSSCNANWGNNRINMFRAGNGCGNTAQIQGVVTHEWGHGFDENDGGDFDNSSEAYADVVAIFESRESCVGRNFRVAQTCAAYGDTCLTCTGVRDLDWDARRDHTPATPAGFLTTYCPSGGGPCGGETHCESYVPAESIFDLATRDLPATGMDPDSAWQLAERLWYQSRPGSGGDIFNCALPSSDSCGIGSWYHQLRLQDDDDGNLLNGTPHAAAIFAAFDRHDIACGAGGDAENQSTSSCSALDAPLVTFTAATNAVNVQWDAVSGAASYRVYRNENGCSRGQFPVAEVAGGATSYLDDGLANGLPVFYRVQAIAANAACESPVSACIEAGAQAQAGRILLDRSSYGCDHEIGLEVTDLNHPSASMTVTIDSNSEPTPETIVLSETAVGSARFTGTIATTTAAPAADGLLSITEGDLITAEYIDLDDGLGGINVSTQATAQADCTQPTITQVRDTNVTDFAATLTWLTDEAGTSQVYFGDAVPLTDEARGAGMTVQHAVTVSGLDACTVYYYAVESADPAGNLATDDNRGQNFHFETLIDAGAGLQPCHQGRITIGADEIACASSVPIELADPDLNLDPGAAEGTVVSVSSTREPIAEWVTLTETGPDTGVFAGAIPTQDATPIQGDGILQVANGGFITATYADADDGTGGSRTSFDEAAVDCVGPEHPFISVSDITDKTAVINWTTSEPTTGQVEFGPTPALGSIVSTGSLSLNHSLGIGTFAECSRAYFRVTSTDALGHTSVADLGGAPFELNVGMVGGAIFRDDLEATGGWSLDGEWEIGAPQGLGSSPGDPTSAFVGAGVLGNDLSGLGAHPGDYEPQMAEIAVSPVIDTSALTGVELQFHRWLNILTGAFGYVEAKDSGGDWNLVWRSPTSGGLVESSWGFQSYDVSAYAAGNADFQLRFRMVSHIASSFHAGWNIDQLILRDTDQPPFESCGGCGGAPTFAGVASAVDDDPCADSPVTLAWSDAPAWGTGSSGTYVVYRDTVDSFAPSPANRVASGIAGAGWTDPNPPAGIPLYYLVRAENGETCSSGPNNGGMVDGNPVYLSVVNETSQPAPGDVGDGLRVEAVNQAHTRLTWTPASGAASYRVYRSPSPTGGFVELIDTTDLEHEDRGSQADSQDWYYSILATDACGNEGPGL